jgi:hypothetical protein
VHMAVQRPPALHRFVNKLPDWLVSAARMVTDEYEADASLIWSGAPTAREL